METEATGLRTCWVGAGGGVSGGKGGVRVRTEPASVRPSERRGPAGSEAAAALPSEGKLFITPGRPGVFPCHSCWVTCVT